MEWQRAQFACANALPAATLVAALQGMDAISALRTTTTPDVNLRFMKLAMRVSIVSVRLRRSTTVTGPPVLRYFLALSNELCVGIPAITFEAWDRAGERTRPTRSLHLPAR
jgi:hypothetical protein